MRLQARATPLRTLALLALAGCNPAQTSEAEATAKHKVAATTEPVAKNAVAKPDPTPDAKPSEDPKPADPEAAPKPGPSEWTSLVAATPALSKAPADSVLAKVRTHAKPVALLASEAGLTLYSLAGMDELIVAGPVDNAMYDPRSGIVLIVRGTSLSAASTLAQFTMGRRDRVSAYRVTRAAGRGTR